MSSTNEDVWCHQTVLFFDGEKARMSRTYYPVPYEVYQKIQQMAEKITTKVSRESLEVLR